MRHRPTLALFTLTGFLSSSLPSGAFAQGGPTGPPVSKPASPAPPAPPAPALAAAPEGGPSAFAASLDPTSRADYESGRLLFADGDFGGAFIKFDAANARAHDDRLLWNMAACQKGLRHYAKTLALLERYAKSPNADISDQDRVDAANLIRTISPLVGLLRVVANEAGARVSVDDEPVGTTPLPASVAVDLGAHRVRVSKEGYAEQATSAMVAGAVDVEVRVELKPVTHQGRLVVKAESGASVMIDDRPTGFGQWEGALSSGGHTVRVTARGKKTFYSEVVISDDQTRTLSVTLDAQDSAPVVWPWVAGGAVLVAGAVVGGYLLFRPKADTGSPPPDGNFNPGTLFLSRHN